MRRRTSTNTVNEVFSDKKATLRVNNKTVIVTPKLFTIAVNIIKMRGKQFVYSHDDTTNQIIAKLLEKIDGWVDITTGVTNREIRYPDTKANNKRSVIASKTHKTHKLYESRYNCKRYILTNDTKYIGVYQAFMSGLNMQQISEKKWKPEPGETARYKRNADGRACRVIFVTGGLYTGVDINALRVVHLTNPFASKVSMRQAHGRATRAYGHSFLPEADRNCQVLTYMTEMSNGNELEDILKPISDVEKIRNKYISAHQWMIKKATIQNSYRVGAVDLMQMNWKPLPTADSIVERQATFDEETTNLDHFEQLLSAKIKSQNR